MDNSIKLNVNNFKGHLPTGEAYKVTTKIVFTEGTPVFIAICKKQLQGLDVWSTHELVGKCFNRYGLEFKESVKTALTELSELIGIELIDNNLKQVA